MKRLLHLWSGNLFGGVESFLIELVKRGRQYEHHVGLSFEGPLSSRLLQQNFPVHFLGEVRTSRPWTVFASCQRLRRLLGAEEFAAVVSHGFWPHVVWSRTVKTFGRPLVFFQHDITSGTHWLEWVGARVRPDGYIANSRASETALLRLMPDVPGRVVFPPVAAGLQSTNEEKREVRGELETNSGATVIVQVGRLDWYKGHMLLLEALEMLPIDVVWECWIVGGAQRPKETVYLNRLRRMSSSGVLSRRVRFLGQRDDVPRLLRSADIFCQPNVKPEAFGIVFVEALANRLPVVAVASGAVPEIIDDTCGRLVTANAADVASALTELLLNRNLREELAGCGAARAEALCDPERQVARFESAVSEVAAL
jgi:glycosyltransferase involved in cell wall biosynthesis